MEEANVVSPSRIERLLELASVYNVPLSITTESKDTEYWYKSRMLEMKKVPGVRSLVIDHPVTDGPAIALKPSIVITVFFALDEERFTFDAEVLRKVSFALANRRQISALEITYPNVIRSDQRRSYYRVSVPTGRPISVEGGVVGDVIDWFVQEPGAWNFPAHVRFEGRILNLSVGGMLLAVKDAGKGMPAVGTKLGLRLSLSPDETPIVLKGVIRRIEERAATEEGAIAIEFIETSEKFEYKLAVNRLYRYVAERQREILQSGAK